MKNTTLLIMITLCFLALLASCKPKHSSTTDIPQAHECNSICSACGKCTDADCSEEVCKNKCNGHVDLPEIDVDDLK